MSRTTTLTLSTKFHRDADESVIDAAVDELEPFSSTLNGLCLPTLMD